MHDLAVCDRAHFIERLALCISMERANVDSLMKPCVNNSGPGLDRIPHESVLSAFPGRGFHAFVIALDILIERGAPAVKQRQRDVLADKLPDLANIGAGLFVFGQFVGQQPPSAPLLVIGAIVWAILIGVALLMAGREAT